MWEGQVQGLGRGRGPTTASPVSPALPLLTQGADMEPEVGHTGKAGFGLVPSKTSRLPWKDDELHPRRHARRRRMTLCQWGKVIHFGLHDLMTTGCAALACRKHSLRPGLLPSSQNLHRAGER